MKPILPLWAAVLVAAASGPIMDAGFPDKDVWPLTLVGIALVLLTLIGRRIGSAVLVGFVAGAAFYFTHIQWAALFLGPLPMSALSVLESLFFASGAVAITLAYRWIPVAFPTAAGRLGLLPVAVAGLWTAREAWASVWPYGGFAWGRVALSQSEGPLAPLFSWVGVSGVSFLMVLVVAVAIEAARMTGLPVLSRIAAPVGLATALVVMPLYPTSQSGTMTVAAVQGNGRAGYFDGSDASELLQAQLDATVPLFGTPVDVVVWPEGTTYRDPILDPTTTAAFDFVSEEMDAPLIAQGVSERDGRFYNTAVLWQAGEGALDFYDKKHPVPFGEYIPDRAFWRPFAPDLIDLIQREYTPGTTDNVFDVDGVLAGINICFDIVDDQILTESVEEGAQIIFASSNNADFGRTDESVQQLAIARIRAIELGRTVVNISTVGTSAMIGPDGSTIAILPWYEPGSMVEVVPLSTTTTPAVLLGRQVEWLVSGLGLGALIVAGLAARTTRTPRRRKGDEALT
ncbi:apolipoprotein N-acyltransferase [Schumannella luteola]